MIEILILGALVLLQPEASSSMETSTSGIDNPLAVTSSHMQPVIVLETLNLSR